MGKHKPSVLWALYKLGRYPNIYLTTMDSKTIKLAFHGHAGDGHGVPLPRRMARLLAKRLNQILNQTAE